MFGPLNIGPWFRINNVFRSGLVYFFILEMKQNKKVLFNILNYLGFKQF